MRPCTAASSKMITSFIIHHLGRQASNMFWGHLSEMLYRASEATTFVNTCRLPVTNLLDEWIGDLPLIAEVVASQLAKITCPTGRQYIENRFQRQSASPGP